MKTEKYARCVAKISLLLTGAIFNFQTCEATDIHDYKKNVDNSTICIDRFLIDLPAPADMAATNERNQDVYGFPGIDDVGSNGAKIENFKISETIPTSKNKLKTVYFEAKTKLVEKTTYSAGLESRKQDILHWENSKKSAPTDQLESIDRMVAKSKKEFEELKYEAAVSGESKSMTSDAFALRRGDEFRFGYLSKEDQRIRTVEGTLKLKNPLTPEAAAQQYVQFRKVYRERAVSDIPKTPGFCTPFGFFSEVKKIENSESDILFRSAKYPNLLFTLKINVATRRDQADIQKMPNMNAENAQLHLLGVKKVYGPIAENIAGMPGRSVGHEFGDNCSAGSCRPADQAYEFEAETFGDANSLDKPHIILHMIAITSDDYRLKLPAQPNEPSYNKPVRPGLHGKTPPPIVEGRAVFEQVLRSIRLRPIAISSN
ncbi:MULTISPECIES: T6SS immunity protein Tli4 family protein [unclassified Duganella]|uniref:T6SS immunity protein Tli4 family protein n=1 Tax=unclassified Duganella TaxID=2636909 RepID=UPI0011C0D312|nr:MULTISPECIES: T6SS immunity protein Tli4 family protein [unclassified Duganella]